jgi:hypothetical protein
MTIAEIIRDSPAGQLARLYLGWKIAPYMDEREDFTAPTLPDAKETIPATTAAHDVEKDDASEKGSSDNPEKEDIERDAADAAPQAAPSHDPNAVEFYGPGDRDNPLNWSTLKKCFVFGQICLLTFAS